MADVAPNRWGEPRSRPKGNPRPLQGRGGGQFKTLYSIELRIDLDGGLHYNNFYFYRASLLMKRYKLQAKYRLCEGLRCLAESSEWSAMKLERESGEHPPTPLILSLEG